MIEHWWIIELKVIFFQNNQQINFLIFFALAFESTSRAKDNWSCLNIFHISLINSRSQRFLHIKRKVLHFQWIFRAFYSFSGRHVLSKQNCLFSVLFHSILFILALLFCQKRFVFSLQSDSFNRVQYTNYLCRILKGINSFAHNLLTKFTIYQMKTEKRRVKT